MITPLRISLAFLLSILFSTLLPAQEARIPFINSSELIRTAINLSHDEKYDEAINTLNSIWENDTNHFVVVYNKALYYAYKENYDSALVLVHQGQKMKCRLQQEFFLLEGNILSSQDKKEEAIAVYKEAIKNNPLNNTIYFNLGKVYFDLSRYKEAETALIMSLQLDPLSDASHYLLGATKIFTGSVVPAMLAISTSLLLTDEPDISNKRLVVLNNFLGGEYDKDMKPEQSTDNTGRNNFQELELLIKGQVAFNKKYDLKCSLDNSISRQMQLLMEKIKLNPGDSGYFSQFYTPLFIKLRENGYTEAMIYALMTSVDKEDFKKAAKKNEKDITAVRKLTVDHISQVMDYREELIDNKKVMAYHIYHDDNSLKAYGEVSKDKKGDLMQEGYWQYFHPNGMLRSKGKFIHAQKQDAWEYFYTDGTLQEKTSYVNDSIDGIYKEYHDNGKLLTDMEYKHGIPDGYLRNYYRNGELHELANKINGKVEGLVKTYTIKGELATEMNFKNDVIEGEYRNYHPNGRKSFETTIVDGEKEGKTIGYYNNGQIEKEEQLVKGRIKGETKYYHRNGKLKSIEPYDEDGKITGTVKDYDVEGRPEDELLFTKDKLNGTAKYFAEEGWVYMQIIYKDDKIMDVNYFDKTGKSYYHAVLKGNKEPVKGFYSNGNIKFEGTYAHDHRTGLWKFYNTYGNLSTVENYTDGKLNGETTNYFNNGKVKNVIEYNNDFKNGYYREFYKNGVIASEGWMVNDTMQGTWKNYYPNGKISAVNYYIDDEIHGKNQRYYYDGTLNDEIICDRGILLGSNSYDSLGKINSQYTLNMGEGQAILKSLNGQEVFNATYVHGLRNDSCFSRYSNGKINARAYYVMGEEEGKFSWYDDDGKLYYSAVYKNGQLEGPELTYHENGKLSSKCSYENNSLEGLSEDYYPNGNICIRKYYKTDNLEGYRTKYAPDGSPAYRLLYKADDLIAWAPPKADGTFEKDIPIEKGTVSFISHFPNGKKSAEINFVNGFIHGPQTDYYIDGQIQEQSNFFHGLLDGNLTDYYPNGKVLKSLQYFYNKKNNLARFYNENGILQKELNFQDDDLHGQAIYYDKTGKPIKTRTYWHDTFYSEKLTTL